MEFAGAGFPPEPPFGLMTPGPAQARPVQELLLSGAAKMKELEKYLVVALGGSFGAVARYALGGWVQTRLGTDFPYGTLVVNLTGCFLLGLFAVLALNLAWSEQWRSFVAIGFLGAYTTFSTFSYETLQLLAQGDRGRAFWNTAGSVGLGLLAGYLGIAAARWILSFRALGAG